MLLDFSDQLQVGHTSFPKLFLYFLTFNILYRKYEQRNACITFQKCSKYEPLHGKTNNLHMRKQRRRSASR